jgi:hypothetical protein
MELEPNSLCNRLSRVSTEEHILRLALSKQVDGKRSQVLYLIDDKVMKMSDMLEPLAIPCKHNVFHYIHQVIHVVPLLPFLILYIDVVH